MVTQVLNYHDVQLYDTDVELFRAPQWLNDNAINFYFQYLYRTVCLREGTPVAEASDVLLMDPAVVSCMQLQCEDGDEYADLGRGMDIQQKRICLIPVNDNQSFDGESSHWSLLVYHVEEKQFQHYDSSAGHNTNAAMRTSRAFHTLLRASGVVDTDDEWSQNAFRNVEEAPQQRNGYDCGMYVLLVATYLCRRHVGDTMSQTSLSEWVTPARVAEHRMEMPALIQRLQQSA